MRARAADFDRPGIFEASVHAEPPLPALAPLVEIAALRVASEAIGNAARHSQGAACAVSLTPKDGGLALTVTDDGTGIPTGRPRGVGLDSMTARATAAGGSLSIRAGGSGGTVVGAWFPADVARTATPGEDAVAR